MATIESTYQLAIKGIEVVTQSHAGRKFAPSKARQSVMQSLGTQISGVACEKLTNLPKDLLLFGRYLQEFQSASDAGPVSHDSLDL